MSDRDFVADGVLLTDLYQLTMAQGYWQQGMADRRANFQLTLRRAPFGGTFGVFCGLGSLLSALERYRFSDQDLAALSKLRTPAGSPFFEELFLAYLADLELSVELWAPEEGTVVFGRTPLVRVEGSLLQGQLLETLVLNLIGFETMVATRAARICHLAAAGQPVLDFGLRRAHGPDGALRMSRAAWIGGVTATSNVLAGATYDIPVAGTHAHSWVLSFDRELEAFRAFVHSQPDNCTLLLDTFDTLAAVDRLAELVRDPEIDARHIQAVRLDSGDLVGLSRTVRQRLDAISLEHVRIVASNDLDEFEIERLRREGACIDAWGVGTALASCRGDAAFSGAYKLTALEEPGGGWRGVQKISHDRFKRSQPGRLQVLRRLRDGQIEWPEEVVDLDHDGRLQRASGASGASGASEASEASEATELMRLHRPGRVVSNALGEARVRVAQQMNQLSEAARQLRPSPS